MLATGLVFAVVISLSVSLLGQPQREQKPLAFEVASVKPNSSQSPVTTRGGTPNLYEVTNAPLRLFVRSAYDVMDFELIGGPGWIDSERFDVIGKLPDGTNRQQVPQMLRELLVERFKLMVHTETRTVATYDLVVAGSNRPLGPNLLTTDIDCAAVVAALQSGSKPSVTLPQQQRGRAPKCGMLGGPGVLSLSGATMKQLSTILSRLANRRVIDHTGLADAYDIDLHFAQESAGNNTSDEPGLLTALQEQLGLKLESTNGPVDVLVIDHVEKPTPD